MFGISPTLAQISGPELQPLLGQADGPLVVDVRDEDEIRAGLIPGARHIPMHLVPLRLAELPRDREIVFVCHSGARSSMVARQLQGQGFRVKNLAGGMSRWRGPVERLP